MAADEVMALSSWNNGWGMSRWLTTNGEENIKDSVGASQVRAKM
jgi:hypothetical protein